MTPSSPRRSTPPAVQRLAAVVLLASLAACGGGGGGGDAGGGGGATDFSIGGSVTGLTSTGLVVNLNGGGSLTVPANATGFAFPARLTRGAAYSVSIATQPGVVGNAQDCTIANGSGTANAEVTNVSISCGPMGPLALSASNPVNAATGVARNVQATFDFSTPLNPATLTGRIGLNVSGGSAAPAPFSFTAAGRRVSLMPTAKLLPLQTYVASFAEGLCGLRNECLPAAVPGVSFTTADGIWKDERTASGTEALREANTPVVLDAEGNALAAWVTQGETGVRVSRFSAASGTWGASLPLAGQPGVPDGVRLAMDAAGNALLVWSQFISGSPAFPAIYAARYSKAGNSWDTPKLISSTDARVLSNHVIAVRPNGDLAVAWRRTDVGPVDSVWLRVSTTAPNAPWLPEDAAGPLRADDPLAPQGSKATVALAMAPRAYAAGARLLVAWQADAPNGTGRVVWGRLLDDNGLQPARVISDNLAATEADPQVAIDGLGAARLVWRRVSGVTGSVWTRVYEGGAWGTGQRLSPTNQNAERPSLASNAPAGSAGVSWVAWVERRTTASAVSYVPWATRPGDAAPTPLTAPVDTVLGGDVQVVVDAADNALAAWRAGTAANPAALYTTRFNARTNAWDATVPTRQLNAPGTQATGFGPGHLSVNAVGDIVIGWCQSPTGQGCSMATRRFD